MGQKDKTVAVASPAKEKVPSIFTIINITTRAYETG